MQNPYEVTTEDKLPTEPPPPAQITLTDCLACSGCVTSAETILISLQSHSEVLHALDSAPPIPRERLWRHNGKGAYANNNGCDSSGIPGRVFVASVSPQVRASLAATYGTSEQEAGWMIGQLLGGPHGLRTGGQYGNDFTWIVDTNAMRELNLVLGAEEVLCPPKHSTPPLGTDGSSATQPRKPILTSACPGWICYSEKSHPHILPHLSRLKSPQALTGTFLKTVLSKQLNIEPSQIWHLAIMPCFDKKLEASRQELTDIYWRPGSDSLPPNPVRDVDCVITAREILMLADSRAISFPSLPRKPLSRTTQIPFPDPILDSFLFPQQHDNLDRRRCRSARRAPQRPAAGSSGGYLHHILLTQRTLHPGSTITSTRGRNADVVEYTLLSPSSVPLFRAARYYGFHNIQNLVRKLKPARASRIPGGKAVGARKPAGKAEVEYAYVEVMACPGGCTNGGGQIKVEDLGALQGIGGGVGQREWLGRVDEAYYSMEEGSDSELEKVDDTAADPLSDTTLSDDPPNPDLINNISPSHIHEILTHWAELTGIDRDKLVYTSYRVVQSDAGKQKGKEMERVVELAGKIGGGW